MGTKHIRKCSLCLVNESEITPFLSGLKKNHPKVEIDLLPGIGTLNIIFKGWDSVDHLVDLTQKKVPHFFFTVKET